jgi:hypothetical protein
MGDVLESIILLSLNNSYYMIIPKQSQKQFIPTLFSSLPISVLS